MTDEELRAMLANVTPGPWEFFRAGEVVGVTPRRSSLGDIAHCSGYHDWRSAAEEKANARLIAAAPDLATEVLRLRAKVDAAEGLAVALRKTMDDLDSVYHSEFDGVWDEGDFDAELAHAKAALAAWEAAK